MSEQSWSHRIAALAVDALVTARLLRKEDFERAVDIVSEEISVRLCLGDVPPVEPRRAMTPSASISLTRAASQHAKGWESQ
jgi:hypothetical protein